jgi:hypothetical protein
MSDLQLWSWIASIVVGFILGQCWFWLNRNYNLTKDIKHDLYCYRGDIEKIVFEIHTRLVVLETKSEERKRLESFSPNNFIIPETPKKKAGRPPKKVEIKNP